MKMIQIVNALPALKKLAKQDMSVKTLYKIEKVLSKCDDEMAFYNDQYSKIVRKYSDVVGDRYVPRDENVDRLNTEINELLDTDVECEIQEVVISINEDIKLSYNDLVMLRGFARIEGED